MEVLEKKYTYSDYEKLGEGAPYQLIGGNLVMNPAPVPTHQRISRNIEYYLFAFVQEHNLGEVFYSPIDVLLGTQEVYQPDILFIAKNRLSIIGEKNIQGAPDLVIEILSESSVYNDLKKKKKVYESGGVQEYWIVDPNDQTIEIYVLKGGKYVLEKEFVKTETLQSPLLLGFSLKLDKVF